MTFVYWDVPAGTVLPEHSHPHEQVAHTFEGEFEIVVDGIKQVLRPGSVSIIPPHAVHSGAPSPIAGYWMSSARCGRIIFSLRCDERREIYTAQFFLGNL